MSKSFTILALIAALAVEGCSTQAQMLDSLQMSAMRTATGRGQSELNCPTVTPTLMSREMAQPPGYTSPAVLESAEYTINVEGCGKQQVYFILCPLGGAECYPAAPGSFVGK